VTRALIYIYIYVHVNFGDSDSDRISYSMSDLIWKFSNGFDVRYLVSEHVADAALVPRSFHLHYTSHI
jgi:hypothetical protein